MSVEVGEDSALLPEEKETIIRWSKTDDRAHIYSAMRGVMNRLLHHPEFEETNRIEQEGCVVGLWGTVPVGVLKVQAKPRTTGSNASVVSQQVLEGGE